MKIYIQVDTNISTKKFKRRVEQSFGSIVWVEDQIDFSNVPWEEDHIDKSWLSTQLDNINEYWNNTIDVYFCIVKARNWQRSGLYGIHLGESYRGSRICLVRNRRKYDDTAVHELLHAIWDYVYTHTGIRLEDKLGVSENGAIHGDADGYEEYQYDELIERIKPYYDLARGEDMADEYRDLAQKAIRLAKKLIRKLRS